MKDRPEALNSGEIALDDIYGDTQNISRIFYLFITMTLTGIAAGIFIVLTTNNTISAAILAAGFLPALFSLYLVQTGRFEAAAATLAVFFILMNTVLSTRGLGIHSINNFAFPIVLIIGSLVVNKRIMFLLTTLTVLCLGWLVFGELNGWYQVNVLERSVPGDFLSASLITILTAVMAHRLTDALFKGFLRLRVEIEERKKLESSLLQRESILETITFAAGQFLKTTDWRETIDLVLAKLGKEFNASHAYLFERQMGPGGEILNSMKYEWTAPGQKSDLVSSAFQNMPRRAAGFDRLYDILDSGEPLVGSASFFTEEEKEYLRSINVKALLEIRVIVNGQHWGTLGFDDVENEREWRPMEVEVIRVAAGVLGAAIERQVKDDMLKTELAERQKLINELELRNAESETLRETTEIITSTLDISEVINRILIQLKRVVKYDSASVWSFQDNVARQIGAVGLPAEASVITQHGLSADEPDFGLWEEGYPYILLDDIQDKYEKFRRPPLDYIHGWLAVPLKLRGRFTGFIALDGNCKGQFTIHDAHLALNYANQVAIALENARLFSDLQAELAERQKLIGELGERNSELERFTYTVSHDLKSPLVTIAGFLRYIEQDVASGDLKRFQMDLERVGDAVEKMQQLLMELLELSRIGRLVNPSVLILFEEIVREAMEATHGRLESGNVRVMIQSGLSEVFGDRPRLVEVLQNLIDNAAKYMGDQPDPLIEIGTRGMEGDLNVYFVRDNGIGIAPEHHTRIFELFNKLDTKSEGTGVGLALVKRTIEVHGGRIWLESEAGKGATFCFTLPGKPKDA